MSRVTRQLAVGRRRCAARAARRPRPAHGPRAPPRSPRGPRRAGPGRRAGGRSGGQPGKDGVGEALAHRGGGDGLEQGFGQGGHATSLSRRVRTAVDTRWRAATAEDAQRPGDASRVEVIDEAQAQCVLRRVRQRGDRASNAPTSYVSSVATAGTSSVGSSRRRARCASIADGGGHAVQPGAQVLGVAQPRVCAQGPQQRVLQNVLGVLMPASLRAWASSSSPCFSTSVQSGGNTTADAPVGTRHRPRMWEALPPPDRVPRAA